MAIANIVLITKGTYGDVVPFLALGAALKKRGNSVTLVTQCHYRDAARRAGLDFDSWDTPRQYHDFIADGPLLETPVGLVEFSDRHVFPHINDERSAIMRHASKPRTVLVVRHMGSLAGQLVAESEQIPLASVFTAVTQASCLPLLAMACRDLLGARINAARASNDLRPVSDWGKWLLSPALHLACWPTWFAQAEATWPANTVNLGFLRNDEAESGEIPPDLMAWAEEAPPVLITGGTSVWRLAERFYGVAAEGCLLAGRRGLIVCRHRELVFTDLPPGIRWYPFLPFASLMSSVAAVIHHGGTSVLVRALSSAVPQLMMPYGTDRPDTAARVARLGVGVRILPSDWNPATVGNALTTLCTTSAVQAACRSVQSRVLDASEIDAGCQAIERLAALP